jgi:SAM-dependent methyltransferase
MNDLLAFVGAALPEPPARVLEVGAGGGELAAHLTDLGYDVTAIDPEPRASHVRPVALHELREPPAAFDAAIAVLSLHHVEPLAESCRVLGEVVRPGGWIVIDEFDVDRFDERAAQWLTAQRTAIGQSCEHDPAAMVAEYREHLHPVERLREELSPYFILGEPVRGAYLHRWNLPASLRDAEEELIAQRRLPSTGARLVGRRAA